MAEVHVIGQVIGGSGFKGHSFFCKWNIQIGGGWRLLEGKGEGQSQVDHSECSVDSVTWSHPIDLHFSCKGIQGWPRLMVQVYQQDEYSRVDLCGYGIVYIPCHPGNHLIDCHTWRPAGTFLEELRRNFLGGGPQLVSTEYIYSASERCRLDTVPSGLVHLDLNIIFRNFEKYGINA